MIDERSMRVGERSWRRRPWPSKRLWVCLAGAVAGVCIVSLLQREVLGAPGGSGAGEAFLRDVIAACAWIPIGVAVFRTARHVPLKASGLKQALPVHLLGIPTSALALNLLIGAGWLAAGVWPDSSTYAAMVAEGTVRHLHVNALIYLLLLTVASVPRRPGGLKGSGEGSGGRSGNGMGGGTVDGEASAAHTSTPREPVVRVAVRHRGRTLLLRAGEIDWIEAAGDYASLHVGARSYLLAKRMGALASQLADEGFIRVHRSAIVNLDRVSELRGEPSGNATLILSNGAEVGISRRRRAEVEAGLAGRDRAGRNGTG